MRYWGLALPHVNWRVNITWLTIDLKFKGKKKKKKKQRENFPESKCPLYPEAQAVVPFPASSECVTDGLDLCELWSDRAALFYDSVPSTGPDLTNAFSKPTAVLKGLWKLLSAYVLD